MGFPYSPNPYNITTNSRTFVPKGLFGQQVAPSIVHCYNPNVSSDAGNVVNAFNERIYYGGGTSLPYDYLDPNTPGCMWKTDEEAFGCCTSFPVTDAVKQSCGPKGIPGFVPGSKLCQDLMLGICEKNWDSQSCTLYLNNWSHIPDVGPVVQDTVSNYINGMATRYPCKYSDGTLGTNDFTTPTINRGKGMCTLLNGGVEGDVGTVRDDSKDDFLNTTLIKLCTATEKGGICDDILQQYCAQFTRNDLVNDSSGVLQKICGCHLPVSGQGPVQQCQSSGNDAQTCLKNISPIIQPSQYNFPGIPLQCDPICVYTDTIQHGPAIPCDQTVCIMENIDISLLNSTCGRGITLNQICGKGDCKDAGPDTTQSTCGKGTGNCFMSNIDVASINSNCGGIFLNQNCNACFTFDPDRPWDVKEVPCCDPANTNGGKCGSPGEGGGGDHGGSGGGDSGGSSVTTIFDWLKKHWLGTGIVFFFLIICVALGVTFWKK